MGEVVMGKVWRDLKYIAANWQRNDRRPIWQIILLIPAFLLYWPARKYVDFMDRF